MEVEIVVMVDIERAASRAAARGLRPQLADRPLFLKNICFLLNFVRKMAENGPFLAKIRNENGPFGTKLRLGLMDSPRQGRQRPTPRFYAAGEVIDFVLVTVYGLNKIMFAPRAIGGPRRGCLPHAQAA
jgi:hypothetical protein